MATKKRLTNEFMEKVLNDSAWKELSCVFQWSEQMLEKYKNKVDWKEISRNNNILWTPVMLEKFKKLIDWEKLSCTSCETILTEECLELFKDYWRWSELSANRNLKLTYELIDKFIDHWDWSELIDDWNKNNLYNIDFLERYIDKIPASKLQESHLWRILVEKRADELKLEVIA